MTKTCVYMSFLTTILAILTVYATTGKQEDAKCKKGLSFASGDNQDVQQALLLMMDAAQEGSAECARHVGYSFLYGKGAAERDEVKGLYWYNIACDRGNVMALGEMARLYADNKHLIEYFDLALADDYLRRAAELDDKTAIRTYAATLHKRGNRKEYFEFLKACSDKQEPWCMGQYAHLLITGEDGHRIRMVKGLNLQREAAELEDGAAMIQEGLLEFQNGDTNAAISFFHKAAKAGQPGALFHLARVYESRKDASGATVQSDFDAEINTLESCTSHGDAECMHLLGLYHLFGVGTLEVNATKGYKLLFESAIKANTKALTALATFYIDGFYVEQDHERAFKLASAAMDGGSSHAQALIDEYNKNDGFIVKPITQAYINQMARKIVPNPRRAADLPRDDTKHDLLPTLKAEEDENIRNALLIAFDSWQKTQNPEAAIILDNYLNKRNLLRQSWLLIAELAATGNSEGLFRAAIKLANGMGVDRDFEKSLPYMKTAAGMGHAEAMERLQEYEINTQGDRKVSPTEIHEML